MLSKEELAKREERLKRRPLAKLNRQKERAKQEERWKRKRLVKLKWQGNNNQKRPIPSNKIQEVCIDTKEALENERNEKIIVESLRRTVDKRKSKTEESCSLRNS